MLDLSVNEREDLGIVVQDLGDGLVLGVILLGQREVRDRKVELGLRVEFGAQACLLAEEFGLTPASVAV